MKVFQKKHLLICGTILVSIGLIGPSVQASTPHNLINQSVIDYYRSILEAQELNKAVEGEVATYTTKDGEEKFYGYKSGKLDDSYAYRDKEVRKIYRGIKTTKRSSALTNYHSAALADPSMIKKEPKPKPFQRKKGDKVNLSGIMMRHGKVTKKKVTKKAAKKTKKKTTRR